MIPGTRALFVPVLLTVVWQLSPQTSALNPSFSLVNFATLATGLQNSSSFSDDVFLSKIVEIFPGDRTNVSALWYDTKHYIFLPIYSPINWIGVTNLWYNTKHYIFLPICSSINWIGVTNLWYNTKHYIFLPICSSINWIGVTNLWYDTKHCIFLPICSPINWIGVTNLFSYIYSYEDLKRWLSHALQRKYYALQSTVAAAMLPGCNLGH